MDAASTSYAYDVFVSYHGGDAAWVSELVGDLGRRGLKVWFDRTQIHAGDAFVSFLERGLASSRCVVVVVSAGSMRSGWVLQEYHRALALVNANPDERVLIAALIDDAEPPGFLANHAWVDFRDAARRAQSLDALVSGIRRDSPLVGVGDFPDSYRADPVPPAGDVDEVEFLARQIARTRADARKLRRIRLVSPVPGVGIVAVLWSSSDAVSSAVLGALVIALPLITLLIGWSATAAELSACERKLQRDQVLRDGLEMCRARTVPGCQRLRARFWELVDQASAPPAQP